MKQINQKKDKVKVKVEVEVTCEKREGGGAGPEKFLRKSACFRYIFYRR